MNCVYSTEKTKRYRFPTHINDLVYDRADAERSESFVVVLEPGGAPPLHKHDDTEQVFYVLSGEGVLTIGKDGETQSIRDGDVIVIRPGLWHSIMAEGGPLRYLAIDCFGAPETRKEPTWDEHVQVLCREQGWDYRNVVEVS